MPQSNKPMESNQSQRFINFAREVGAEQDEEAFDRALRMMRAPGRVSPPSRDPDEFDEQAGE